MSIHDDYMRVTRDRLIESLDRGDLPFWHCGWTAGTPPPIAMSIPYNVVSGKGYRGGNSLGLLATQMELGYPTGQWMTRHQGMQLGGRLLKGSHHTKIQIFRNANEVSKEGQAPRLDRHGNEYNGPLVSYAQVFNAAQFEGLPLEHEAPVQTEKWCHDECERLLRDSGVTMRHGGNKAFYDVGNDFVQLPTKAQFENPFDYYSVALHECGHASGAKSRMARESLMSSGKFGSESYAREELVAEIFSVFAGLRLGIGNNPNSEFQNHAAYIKHWSAILKDENGHKAIFRAAADAEKICTYLGIEGYQREPMKILGQEKEQASTIDQSHEQEPARASNREMEMSM